MKILAIDPALSTTGIAVLNEDKTIVTISKFVTKKDKFESEDLRIHEIVKYLHNTAKIHNTSVIVLEDGYSGVNKKTALQLSKLRGAIIESFLLSEKEVEYSLPSHIRKSLGLKGNASKEEVAKYLTVLYPFLESMIGPYSDAQNKKKTSDMYDAVSIGVGYLSR